MDTLHYGSFLIKKKKEKEKGGQNKQEDYGILNFPSSMY
jgi:hypothetical protein